MEGEETSSFSRNVEFIVKLLREIVVHVEKNCKFRKLYVCVVISIYIL